MTDQPDNQALPEPGGEPVARLRQTIRRGHARWKRLSILESAGLTIAVPLAYLWAVFLLDGVVHLSLFGRTLASVVFFAGLIALGWRLITSWRRARFSEDQVALAIEKRTLATLENRLINSLQLSRSATPDSAPISRAVVRENLQHLQQIRLEPPVQSRSALVRVGLAGALIGVGILFWAFQRERFTNAATRIFLPFSDIAPLYRTTLTVEPGDVEARQGEDVTIRITIKGRIPAALAVLQQIDDKRSSAVLPVPAGANRVTYTFKSIAQSITYAVRGDDYVSPFYLINVTTPSEIKQLAVTYRYPAYTQLPERRQESSSGDLEALFGTHASLRFALSRPVDEATMVIEKTTGAAAPPAAENASSNLEAAAERVALKAVSPTEFTTDLVLQDQTGYRLEMRQADRPAYASKRYDIHVVPDRAPELQLAGIDQFTEIMVDAILPLTLIARDDYGLTEAGVFYRISRSKATAPAGEAPTTNGEWQAVQCWPVADQAATFHSDCALPVASLNVVEGEEIELAARARDTDPLKGGMWTTGPTYPLLTGGSGAALQVLYEQMLRIEADFQTLIQAQAQALDADAGWVRKLEPESGLRWDDQQNLDALAAAMRDQAAGQSQLRRQTADLARDMAKSAGNIRIAVGMLADTEMVRCIRILENVPTRDTPQSKRGALADARLTQERTLRSLRELYEQYVQFRKDWELNNMIPFTKMLAERQERMQSESLTYAQLSATIAGEQLRQGTSARQLKVLDLAGLAQTAFAGMGGRTDAVGQVMAQAFQEASTAFASGNLKPTLRHAADSLRAGEWTAAATNQQAAAAILAAIHARLLQVQAEVARQALADLQNLAASSLEAQKEIEKLKAGSSTNLIDYDESKLKLEDILHMRELAEELKKKIHASKEDQVNNYLLEESLKDLLDKANLNIVQQFSIVSLAKEPSGESKFPNFSDREANRIRSVVQEKFEDLVGDLLEEADDLRKQYETYNITAALRFNDAGPIGKGGGNLSSTAAQGFTGNMKPPTMDIGGASRTGRQGGRAHGMAVGDESINRRGRDEVQEGREEVPDQPGQMKETKSKDPQKDSSTGYGGKEIKSDETSFSLKDAGEWKDELVDRMKPPQAKNQIVERQGKPLNPRVAEMLRDLESTQRQVIERVKTIKKELDQLYLPTEQLDEIAGQLNANLDRLKESPDADVYRLQLETLDKLKGAIVVFNRPSSEFQPSLPREQVVRGHILDEPAWPTLPGYEDAVKRYYEKLSAP